MRSRVELVWEKDCPNAEAARGVVAAALRQAGLPGRWDEFEIGVDELPAHAQGFGSPTILVDGKDVAGKDGDGSDDCCRIYISEDGMAGVPAVADVVARLREPPGNTQKPRGRAVAMGALVAAILSSACCWLPLLLIGVGASAGGVAAVFEAYRPWLLGATSLLLVAAFYLTYRPQPACGPDGSCKPVNRRLQRLNRIVLWVATAAVVGFATFPSWMEIVAGGSADAVVTAPDTAEVRYHVEGMHCQGCTGLLEAELAKLPEVESVRVSYEDKTAVLVLRPGKAVSDDAIARAGDEVGFTLTKR